MSLPGDQISAKVVPRTYAWIKFKDFDIKYIIGKKRLLFEQVLEFIQKIMNETLELTIKETEEWIDEFVPKRSGDLREDLKKFLAKSRPPPSTKGELRNVRLILGAGADVKYARHVTEMSAEQVQHDATWFEHSGKRAYSKGKPVFLDDPHAVSDYHTKMVSYAIERLKINLSKIKWMMIT